MNNASAQAFEDPGRGSVPPPRHVRSLPCTPTSAARARRIVRATLTSWGLPHLTEPAALVASELVTNSLLHTSSLTLRLSLTRPADGLVRIGVVDRSFRAPALQRAGECGEGGRGLALVDALACRWGTDPLPWGKRVWAELACGEEA
ncbi:ATP-binding protein [Streptomyces physcomitrii]|uniref:ATP-binding protein n=1 Tax=Streptomyces physcomitrii TaxID=2724184 RepID=UPI000865A84E|nr:regulatory protein [Streptomyces albus]